MTQTLRHNFPLIESNQALKHVIHNEAITAIDATLHLKFTAMDLNDPPISPALGETIAIGAAPTSDFIGHAGEIAFFDNNGWHFYLATEGMLGWNETTQKLMVYQAGVWSQFDQAPSSVQNAQFVGVMTDADATNRLAVKTEAALFSHADAGDDLRFKLNKSGPSATASFLFQSAWSGRAEVGLAGNDDLSIKVSPDGASWQNALVVERATGRVLTPKGFSAESVGVANKLNLLPNAGRMAIEETHAVSTFSMPSGIAAENGAVVSAFAQFQTDSTDFGGAAPANNADLVSLGSALKSTSAARAWMEFWAATCTTGSGTGYEHTASGASKYRVLSSNLMTPNNVSSSVYFLVKSGTVLVDGNQNEVWVNDVLVSDYQIIAAADGWVHVNVIEQPMPSNASNWSKTLFPIYATAGDQFLFAFPAILPDAVRVPQYVGPVPSLV